MKRAERAMQIWQILISLAHNRSTITYGQLGGLMKIDGAGVFAQILGCIMFYCQSNQLPPLTCIVVNQSTGLPGEGLTTVEDLPKDRENVYRHNWYAMYPVQITDFEPFA